MSPLACVLCGSIDETTGWLEPYGMGVVSGNPVEAVVCQDCPLPLYGSDGEPNLDPAIFAFAPDPTNTYLIMTRRPEGIST